MRRREFIALLGSVTAAWPLAALAQQPTGNMRLGVLLNLSENDVEAQRLLKAFRDGLAQLGWIDGRNLRIDYRWAGGDVGRIRTFAKELVELSPDIMVGYATPSVAALQQETRSIPIVFLSVTDPDSFNMVHRRTIIAQVDRYRLPAMYYFPFFARDGGLISYGPDEANMFRQAAGYVDRILKGAKVGDLPVQQPTKYELVINLKTAKAPGFIVPEPFLQTADEVIE
jgi:ABC-type uncharacterized transport system substrate-binding protein